MARSFAGFVLYRTRMPRARFSQAYVRSTTQRRARALAKPFAGTKLLRHIEELMRIQTAKRPKVEAYCKTQDLGNAGGRSSCRVRRDGPLPCVVFGVL